MSKKKKTVKRKKQNFNDNHPEMKKGEVFVTNIFTSRPDEFRLGDGWEVYKNLQLRSKRMGAVAYDSKGSILWNATPVFAKKEEFEKKKRSLWSKEFLDSLI